MDKTFSRLHIQLVIQRNKVSFANSSLLLLREYLKELLFWGRSHSKINISNS
jgi:hypothetical protein